MRLWIKQKTIYTDMDRLDIVTLIQCCEGKGDANEEKQKNSRTEIHKNPGAAVFYIYKE